VAVRGKRCRGAGHRANVSFVNAQNTGADLGRFPYSGAGRDPPDQARLRQLAAEQAALRRVATLVARGAAPEKVFAAVAEEVGQLFPVDLATVCRYDSDRTLNFVASWGRVGEHFPVGSQGVLGGRNVVTRVFETSRPVRIDDYAERASGVQGALVREAGVRSAVGTPILVEGRLWGVISAASSLEQPLPADTEARLASFTELVATAIANAESRAALARMAEEQAALRRVAMLVARGAAPEEVFAVVAEEVGQLLPVDSASMCRYESDGTLTFVAQWGGVGDRFPVRSRWPLGGHNLGTLVFETGQLVRVDGYADSSSGPLGAGIRDAGLRSAVGAPVLVEGRLWGLIAAGSGLEQPLPPDTEARLVSFTELVATAIANAEGRAALAASRARIVTAADETRRRIERDLHDGTQQQLVSLMLELRTAQAAVPSQLSDLTGQLSHIAGGLSGVFERVREISHGIHPAILSERGLTSALKTLARRSAVPVELDLRTRRRLPGQVEVAAYYAVSEALANAAKHAHASIVHIGLDTADAIVRLAIRDDGVGGADPARGSGLTGLRDRIEAVGGTLDVTSLAGHGTTLLIEIPVKGQDGPRASEP
jgi:signal transduction histidine kinase